MISVRVAASLFQTVIGARLFGALCAALAVALAFGIALCVTLFMAPGTARGVALAMYRCVTFAVTSAALEDDSTIHIGPLAAVQLLHHLLRAAPVHGTHRLQPCVIVVRQPWEIATS